MASVTNAASSPWPTRGRTLKAASFSFYTKTSYTIFGRVTKGIEVVDALAEVPTTRGMDGGMSKPTTPPVMKKVTIRQ